MPNRKKDLVAIYNCISTGESAQVLGLSGVGKSNHFNKVLDPKNVKNHFIELAHDPILVRVNFHYAVDFEPRTVYSLMLEPLESLNRDDEDEALRERIEDIHNKLLDVGDDILKAQRLFRQGLRLVMGPENQIIYFVFDQFDKMMREAPSRLFSNLRGLREEFKYRLGFIIFTRQPLDKLVPDTQETHEDYEEFLELFQSRKIGLRPYEIEDSTANVESLLKRNDFNLPAERLAEIYNLSGGHGGLNKALVYAVCQENQELSSALVDHTHVRTECRKIWEGLDDFERAWLNQKLKGKAVKNEDKLSIQRARDLLVLKGCINPEGELFSPLFKGYIQNNREYEHALEYDPAQKIVSIFGVEQSPLTNREVEIFEYLFERAGEVVSAEALAKVIWGDSDQSALSTLRQNISRLRKKVQAAGNPSRFIAKAPSGSGYILRID